MQIVIRLILSAVLVYFVWIETGWATATAISLMTISNEISSFTISKILEALKILSKR